MAITKNLELDAFFILGETDFLYQQLETTVQLDELELLLVLKLKTDKDLYHAAIAGHISDSFGDYTNYNLQSVLNFLGYLDVQLNILQTSPTPQDCLDAFITDYQRIQEGKQFNNFDAEDVISYVQWNLVSEAVKECKRMREAGRYFSDYAVTVFNNQKLFDANEESSFYLQIGDALGF